MTDLKVETVERDPDGMMLTTLSNGKNIKTEQILVSIGRSMNSEGIGLEQAGVTQGTARGNNRERPDGDECSRNLRHRRCYRKNAACPCSFSSRAVAAENAMGGSTVMDYSMSAFGHFYDAGDRQRRGTGAGAGTALKCRIGKFQFRALGKAHAMGEITGMVKIIADADSDKVMGVHICGAHATDLIHEGVLAMKEGATSKDLAGMIHAHPTLSEAIMEAAEDVHGMAIHVQNLTTPDPFCPTRLQASTSLSNLLFLLNQR